MDVRAPKADVLGGEPGNGRTRRQRQLDIRKEQSGEYKPPLDVETDGQSLRMSLKWVDQNDSYSCGPLAAAGIVMLINGVRPTWEALGAKGMSASAEEQKFLRDWLTTSLLHSWVIGDGTVRRPAWFTDKECWRDLKPWFKLYDTRGEQNERGGGDHDYEEEEDENIGSGVLDEAEEDDESVEDGGDDGDYVDA